MAYSRFYLSDLHVHTPADVNHRYGSDAGGREPSTQFAERLIDRHVAVGVRVIAVADHNRVDWWPVLYAEGKKRGVTVFPALEISVNGCHLIGIWDANTAGHELAKRFLIRAFEPGQNLFKDGHPRPVTSGQVVQIGELVIEHQGILLAPHSTTKGIGIFAAGVCSNSDEIAQGELVAAFDVMGNKGADVLSNPRSKFGDVPPRWYLSGDTRSLEDVGKSAVFLKLGAKPSLEGIRQAFLAPATRVRFPEALRPDWGRVKGIEFIDSPEPNWPRLTRLKIEGGFHDQLDIPFAPGLSAVIGGKGTGKSALIEILRYLTGGPSPADLKLRENRVHNFPPNADGVLEFVDEAGEIYESRRSGGSGAAALHRNGARTEVPVDRRLHIQIFGQRELQELGEPDALRTFVAGQAGQDWYKTCEEERSLVHDLDERSTTLGVKERELTALDDLAQERADLNERVERARKLGAEKAIDDSKAITLADERVRRALEWPDRVRMLTIQAGRSLLPPPSLADAPTAPPALTKLLTDVSKRLGAALADVEAALDADPSAVATMAREWQALLGSARGDVERRLAEAGVTNAQELSTWQSRLAQLHEDLETAPDRRAELTRLSTERDIKLRQLAALRRKKSRQIESAAKALQQVLPVRVRLRISPLGDKTAFRRRLDKAVEGQSVRGDQLGILSQLEPQTVVGAARQGVEEVTRLGVTGTTAAKLVALAPEALRALETCDVPDLVELDIDLGQDGTGQWRSVAEVSPGQRATALLALALAGGRDPLVIDQPEDDLDNRYIYDEVVKVVARVCEHRQVIVATHNANIPILGDASLVVALDADATRSRIVVCGGLEVPAVAAQARQILEGGDEAFQARRRRYLAAR